MNLWALYGAPILFVGMKGWILELIIERGVMS